MQFSSLKPFQSSSKKDADDSPADQRSIWWGFFPVALVALIGLLFTLAAFIRYSGWENDQVETAFREASQDRILVIQRELKHTLGIVQDIASFFEASEIVGRREFRKFVGPALQRQAGIKSLEWIPIVFGDERNDFVGEARRSFPPFRITEFDSAGGLIERTPQVIHYPVLYVQPYQANKQRLGLDLAADPNVLALLQRSEKAQTLQVSPDRLDHIENIDKNRILVAVPVFFQDETIGVTNTAKLRGFALGVFYVGEIVEQALQSLRSGGVDIHLYLTRDTGTDLRLYTHLSRLRKGPGADKDSTARNLSYSEKIRVGNQDWNIVCTPAAERFKSEAWGSWIILAAGLALTVLLTIYLASLVGRERQVRQQVDERTSQLQQVVQALNREVSERVSAEQELQDLNERLEQHIVERTAEAERRAQYLEQFAYVASHDLKAPLRAVSNLAQWIEEDLSDKLDDASREQLVLLRDRVRRMHDLIEGLLEYSRVGKINDVAREVNTGELIHEIIDSFSPPKGFKILVKDEMPTLQADRLQLGQVFSNLISNSLKHHGGKKGKIRVNSESDGEFYRFSVCDNGQGVAPEYHDKIFMMFQTLESSDFESSTGIGLALVKKIVDEHGGTIWVESAVGKGACFFFTWPKNMTKTK